MDKTVTSVDQRSRVEYNDHGIHLGKGSSASGVLRNDHRGRKILGYIEGLHYYM